MPQFSYIYCKEHGKWSEVPYIQAFMALYQICTLVIVSQDLMLWRPHSCKLLLSIHCLLSNLPSQAIF